MSVSIRYACIITLILSLSGSGTIAQFAPAIDTSPLHMAASEGNMEEIARLITTNPALVHTHARGGRGHSISFVTQWTPLHEAAYTGQAEAARLLIDNGADPNAETGPCRAMLTPLFVAVQAEQTEVWPLLMQHSSEPVREKAITHAMLNKSPEMFASLLDRHEGFAAGSEHARRLMHLTPEAPGHLPVLEARGVRIDLIAATGLGDIKRMKGILADDPEQLNTLTSNKETALHVAVRQKQFEAAELLLGHGADPDRVSISGLTPLHRTIWHDDQRFADLLLKHGANPNLAVMARLGREQEIRTVLAATPELVNRKDTYQDRTPLAMAIWGNHRPIVKLLIEHGADVNLPSGQRSFIATPLMLAARHGDAELARLLIENGADVNRSVSAPHNPTPLMEVFRHRNKEVEEVLLKAGAVDPRRPQHPATTRPAAPIPASRLE